DSFIFLAKLGMYFLLFIIGFELDIRKVWESKFFIIKTTAAVIAAETFFGTLLVHYVFGVSWIISVLVASSFATVGEAVLLPILEEFGLIKTKLGQTILSIGVMDDLIEVATIVFASVLVGYSAGYSSISIWFNLLILISLFLAIFLLIRFKSYFKSFKYKDISSLFLFLLFFIFAFIGIGGFVESAALGALLAGIALRNIIPDKVLNYIDSEIKTMSYGFFAPIFFLWVGVDTDVTFLIKFPLLVVLVMLMTKTTKILTSYIMGRKELGGKKAILLGISLCVKFSTSIVIIKFLFEKGLIPSSLYSVLVGTTIAFKFVVPLLLSSLITRWKIGVSKG
ncbi:MAG: cation:proton antiporter, partial [Candidatus Nanoarchaeia archaeon]